MIWGIIFISNLMLFQDLDSTIQIFKVFLVILRKNELPMIYYGRMCPLQSGGRRIYSNEPYPIGCGADLGDPERA